MSDAEVRVPDQRREAPDPGSGDGQPDRVRVRCTRCGWFQHVSGWETYTRAMQLYVAHHAQQHYEADPAYEIKHV